MVPTEDVHCSMSFPDSQLRQQWQRRFVEGAGREVAASGLTGLNMFEEHEVCG